MEQKKSTTENTKEKKEKEEKTALEEPQNEAIMIESIKKMKTVKKGTTKPPLVTSCELLANVAEIYNEARK